MCVSLSDLDYHPLGPDSQQPSSTTSITTLPTLATPLLHYPRHHCPPPSTTLHSHQLPPLPHAQCCLLPSPSNPNSQRPPSTTSITTLPTLTISSSHHPRRHHCCHLRHPFPPPSITPHSHQLPPHHRRHPLPSSSSPLHPSPVSRTTPSAGMS